MNDILFVISLLCLTACISLFIGAHIYGRLIGRGVVPMSMSASQAYAIYKETGGFPDVPTNEARFPRWISITCGALAALGAPSVIYLVAVNI